VSELDALLHALERLADIPDDMLDTEPDDDGPDCGA
jgi:hypothetical protein